MKSLIKGKRLATEILSIPYKKKYIIYAPLKRLAFLVNPALAGLIYQISVDGDSAIRSKKQKDAIKPLMRLGLIGNADEIVDSCDNPEKIFAPTFLTLFITTACNMRCTYCYASGGIKNTELHINVAKAAIDFVIRNSEMKQVKNLEVSFHGGGEQTMAWKKLVWCIEYSKTKAIEKKLGVGMFLSSNGVLSKEKLNWLMDNLQGLTLSLDGTEEIQDCQRPMANGKGSFDKVMATVERLNNRGFPYSVRVTVTDTSVKRLEEIVDFIATTCRTRRIQLEPTFVCGRCATTGASAPSANEFIERFRKAQRIADQYDIELFYSGARLGVLTTSFCQAAGDSFCVTPQGDVTSCYEVCSRDDSRSEVFFYGKYEKRKRGFIFSNEKLSYLRKRTVSNISHCKDCFCKYHCAGDCLVQSSMGSDLLSINNAYRCKINQSLTLDQILRCMKTGM